jgi:hypothetical protein
MGKDPDRDGPEIRARLGVVPQEDNLDLELSVADNLYVYGRYFGIGRRDLKRRIAELLEFARLSERANDRVDNLSGGMKRRLTIARSLVNEPAMLLLDEPTTGLDPQARHLLWDRLFSLKHEGVTRVLTTHYIEPELFEPELLEPELLEPELLTPNCRAQIVEPKLLSTAEIPVAFRPLGCSWVQFRRTWKATTAASCAPGRTSTRSSLSSCRCSSSPPPSSPFSVLPRWLQLVVQCLPLSPGVALCRGFSLGQLSWGMAIQAAYLVALAIGAGLVGRRRVTGLLTP